MGPGSGTSFASRRIAQTARCAKESELASTPSTTSRPSTSSSTAAASAPRRATSARAGKATPGTRTFVLDTSVLLSDPRAMLRFAEHEVVLPVVVVTELEGKRHHPELGYFARSALRTLDELRIKAGRLDAPVPVGEDGGTLRVELNHTDPSALPAGFRLGDNDTRILSVAKNLSNEGRAVTIVSKDLPMRVKASAVGLDAEEYRAELAVDSGWTGMAEVDVTAEEMAALYENGRVEHAGAAEMPCHTGLVLLSPRGSGLGRVGPDKQVRLVRGDRDAFGLHGRSAEQRIALDLLLDPDVGTTRSSSSTRRSPWSATSS
jgi:PhoH-like ATPase